MDDRFDLYGCFLGDHRILLKTIAHGLVLCTADLHPHGWINLAGHDPDGDTEIETVLGVTEDAFAELWTDGAGLATVWRAPP